MRNTSPLDTRILDRIRKDRISPKPLWFYRAFRMMLWIAIISLVTISSLLASFFIQDSLDIFRFRQYARGSVFLPGLIWAFLILLCGYLGFRAFRKTPTGYRHPLVRDAIVWLMALILLTPLLRLSGFGPYLHSAFVDGFPHVADFVYQASSWNNPDGGRLAGTVLSTGGDVAIIRSLDGTEWRVDISNAKIGSAVELKAGERIRVMGSAHSDKEFVSERILPWFGKGGGNGRFGNSGRFSE